jgi:hypothetical protein
MYAVLYNGMKKTRGNSKEDKYHNRYSIKTFGGTTRTGRNPYALKGGQYSDGYSRNRTGDVD